MKSLFYNSASYLHYKKLEIFRSIFLKIKKVCEAIFIHKLYMIFNKKSLKISIETITILKKIENL